MDSLANVLQYVNIAAFGVLAIVCLQRWRARRGEAAFWAFATFGLLAIVAVTGQIVDAAGNPQLWITKALVALIALFPYSLYRFAASFGRPAHWIEWPAPPLRSSCGASLSRTFRTRASRDRPPSPSSS